MTALPEVFVRNVLGVYGETAGRAWLDGLPGLLAGVADRWELRLGEPYGLSMNYVTSAVRADGTPAVLKLTPPAGELTLRGGRAAALRRVGGGAAARRGRRRRRRCCWSGPQPGELLTALQARDDEAATRIAAEVGIALHRPATAPLRTVRRLGAGGLRLAARPLRRRHRAAAGRPAGPGRGASTPSWSRRPRRRCCCTATCTTTTS